MRTGLPCGQVGGKRCPPGPASEPRRATAALTAGVIAVLGWWLACKVLLFHQLEYFGSDFFSFLQMSKSFRYTGRLLFENAYGNHAAIHNFYTLPALFPLTYPFGGYGLILALAAVYLAAGLAVARTPLLAPAGRIAVLAALLSPVGYFIFDNPQWGFHPELTYQPLAVLLALLTLAGRVRLAVVTALVLAATKEDGAIVVAAVLLPLFLSRLWRAWDEPLARARAARRLLAMLCVCALVFAAGLLLLHLQRPAVRPGQVVAYGRLQEALSVTSAAVLGTGRPEWTWRLWRGLALLAGLGLSCGALAGRRAGRYVLLLGPSLLLVLPVLVVSAGIYGFGLLIWPPRLATFMAPVLATLIAVCAEERAQSAPARVGTRLALGGLLWVVQAVALLLSGYDAARANPVSLLDARAFRRGQLTPAEAALAGCLAARLPRDFPIASSGPQTPLFHRQAIVFPGREEFAWSPARLRIEQGGAVPCREGVGSLCVSGDPELAGTVETCIEKATARRPRAPR